jgi:hypothetical protein
VPGQPDGCRPMTGAAPPITFGNRRRTPTRKRVLNPPKNKPWDSLPIRSHAPRIDSRPMFGACHVR